MNNKENVIVIKSDNYLYNKNSPFRPSIKYPEYPWSELAKEDNNAYEMVREGFRLSEYDKKHYGTSSWNPLSKFIRAGDTVLIKPNMVMDENHIKENGTECLYTNPSVVAAVIDYVYIALKGKGKIVIGDAPMQECDFERLLQTSGYDKLLEYYRTKLLESDIKIELQDFRGLISKRINGINHSHEVEVCSVIVDLGENSEFYNESAKTYNDIRITNYDPNLLRKHHNAECNEYCINRSVLSADVIINMPKPKTHRKAGVTISMKNLVGINCRKEYLPHHTNGAKCEGGDEYLNKSVCKKMMDSLLDKKNYLQQTKKNYRSAWLLSKICSAISKVSDLFSTDKFNEGNWYGNDTISKTIVDLNKILFYADKKGKLCNQPQREYLIVADMIVSGEKEGPVAPSPKNVGMIAMGEDPVCFDEAIGALMGAKLEYINTLKHARNPKGAFKITEKNSRAHFISNDKILNGKYVDNLEKDNFLYFIPTSGWKKAFREIK